VRIFLLAASLLLFSGLALAKYPSHWWKTISETERQGSWEILPDELLRGELILSKRNELGAFSNLANTPFIMDGILYASVEALWQMMKYPDATDHLDSRNEINEYPFMREEIYGLYGFEAKRAGDAANNINKANDINYVSYRKQQFNYMDMARGSSTHYKIITRAIREKINQNSKLKILLNSTKGLILKPDHKQGNHAPKSYFYHEILMKIRDSR
jgi:predicted NAD-dependent protein-ADP-ribosyltransferase YbiA (DUF1768 family)